MFSGQLRSQVVLMSFILEKNLINLSSKDVKLIREEFNAGNDEDREKALDILEEWVRQQQHFVNKKFRRDYLERYLLTSNGSIERAKTQIDKMCTFRTLIPEYFTITNIMEHDIARVFQVLDFSILPRLTENRLRVTLFRFIPNVELPSDIASLYCKLMVFLAEFYMNFDYQSGNIVIVDLVDVSIGELIRNFNIMEFLKSMPITTEGYGAKIKNITIITSSSLVDKLAALIKSMLTDKLKKRFYVLKTRSEVSKMIGSGEILPEEYGGKDPSLTLSSKKFLQFFATPSYIKLMEELNASKTDETKRPKDQFNDQYMGVPGTFRNMSLE